MDNNDNVWTNVEISAHYDMDMHGFPVYQSVKEVEKDLKVLIDRLAKLNS